MAGFNLGDVFVTFKAKYGDLQSGFTKVKSLASGVQKTINSASFSKFSSNASTAFNSVADAIASVAKKALILTGGGLFGVGKFVSLASDLQTTQMRMAALAGSTAKAAKIFAQLYTYTLGKPIAFPDAAKAAQTLMGYGIQTKNVIGAMKTLSAFSIVNGADMGQLALAYGQVNAKGKLMGQEVLQLTNNFVPVSRVIAKYFNVSLKEAQNRIEQGKVSAQDFNKAMANFIPQSSIAKQSNTFKNRLISLQGTIRKFGLALIGVKVDPKLGLVVQPGGVFDRLSKMLPKIADDLKKLIPTLTGFMDVMLRHGPMIVSILTGIASAFVLAKVAAVGFKIAAMAATGALKKNAIAAVIIAIISTLIALQQRYNWIGKTVKALQGAFKALQGWVGDVISKFKAFAGVVTDIYKNVLAKIEKALDKVREYLDKVGKAATDLYKGALAKLKSAYDKVKDAVNDTTQFLERNKKTFEAIAQFLGVLFGPLMIKWAAQAVWLAGQMVLSAAKSAAAWTLAHAQMAAKATWSAGVSVASAIRSGGAWVAQAARGAYAWATITLPSIARQAVVTATTNALQAARSGAAWVFQAARSGGAWVAQFVVMKAQALWAAGIMIAQAVRTGIAWVIALGPVSIAIGAVAAAAFLIVKNWGTVKKWMGSFLGWLRSGFSSAIGGIKSMWGSLLSKVKSVGSGIGNAIKKAASAVSAPFRAAFNAVSSFWNSTIGKVHFNLPKWIPKLGGKGFSFPQMAHAALGTPNFAGGMIRINEFGPETAVLPPGTRVLTAEQTRKNDQGGNVYHMHFEGVMARSESELADIMEKGIRTLDRRLRGSGKPQIMGGRP